MIYRLYTVYNKHEMIKTGSQPEKKRELYCKCWNSFAADCILQIAIETPKLKILIHFLITVLI